jgi:hypothetical protein
MLVVELLLAWESWILRIGRRRIVGNGLRSSWVEEELPLIGTVVVMKVALVLTICIAGMLTGISSLSITSVAGTAGVASTTSTGNPASCTSRS